MIPKKIHYCWFGGLEMNPLQQACVASWSKNLPDYEVFRWDESNVDAVDPLVNHLLKRKQWAFASDYVRLLKVFEHGGVYLDTDVEVIVSFDALLEHKAFLGRESKDYLNSAIFGAEKRHPFVLECINFMRDRFSKRKSILAAPDIVTQCYSNFYDKTTVFVCPEETFYPYNPYVDDVKQLMYGNITASTFAIHHWAKTWSFTFPQKIKRLLSGKL